MPLCWILPVLLSPAPSSEVFLEVFNGNAKIGVTRYSSLMLSDGGKRSVMDLQMNAKGQSGRFTTTQVVNSEGQQESITMVVTQITSKQKVNATMQATISAKGDVKLLANSQGRRRVRNIAAPKGGSIKDPTEMWFVKIQPKAGATAQFFHFSVENLKWEQIKVTYKGKQSLKTHGQTLMAHYVEQLKDGKMQKMYFDDSGMPILIISGTVKLERQ